MSIQNVTLVNVRQINFLEVRGGADDGTELFMIELEDGTPEGPAYFFTIPTAMKIANGLLQALPSEDESGLSWLLCTDPQFMSEVEHERRTVEGSVVSLVRISSGKMCGKKRKIYCLFFQTDEGILGYGITRSTAERILRSFLQTLHRCGFQLTKRDDVPETSADGS